ncbi:unnamed protein product, partial [Didymodactylos carnosus]
MEQHTGSNKKQGSNDESSNSAIGLQLEADCVREQERSLVTNEVNLRLPPAIGCSQPTPSFLKFDNDFISSGDMHREYENDVHQIRSTTANLEHLPSFQNDQLRSTKATTIITSTFHQSDTNFRSDHDDKSMCPYYKSSTDGILQIVEDTLNIFYHANHGNFEAIRKIINVNYVQAVQMKNEKQQILLHVAVIHSFSYVWIRLLLMCGSDPCAQDQDGYTPAHYAVEKDDIEMLKALTVKLQVKTKPLQHSDVDKIHESCIQALTVIEKS